MKQISELHVAGLYGDGLLLIDEPVLVKRYNDCLKDMGLETSKKRKFHIDCLGWSPELAETFENNFYLSHGLANPLAIILTPEQRHCPIYFPFHSFDWELMKQWFSQYFREISEVTKYSGIWLDIDQEVEEYAQPSDLVMVDDIVVRAKTPSFFMVKVAQQQTLVQQIYDEDDIFEVEQISQSSIKSIKEIGDMREKSVVINNFHFRDICTFYTRAFGGTFVFCGIDNDEYYILNKYTAKRARGVSSVIDKNILSRLEELGLIDYNLDWWHKQFYRLKIIRDSFLYDVLDDIFPDLDFISLNTARQKGIKRDIMSQLPVEYFELKSLIYDLEKGKIPKSVSSDILPFLAHPVDEVSMASAEVIWHALAFVCDKRQIVRLFRQDKDEFYTEYAKWKTPKRRWATSIVTKYYHHRMMSK